VDLEVATKAWAKVARAAREEARARVAWATGQWVLEEAVALAWVVVVAETATRARMVAVARAVAVVELLLQANDHLLRVARQRVKMEMSIPARATSMSSA